MSTDRPQDLAGKISAALDRLARAQRAGRQGRATRHGLTPLQVDLLATLADGPPPDPRVGPLAHEVAVAQPTATDSLQALVAKGLIVRRVDETDARRAVFTLTSAGEQLVADTVAAAVPSDDLTAAIAALPQAEQEATLTTLLTLIARLVDTGAITVARTCLTCHFHRFAANTHRCTLLARDLPPAELRINCPEHQRAGVG